MLTKPANRPLGSTVERLVLVRCFGDDEDLVRWLAGVPWMMHQLASFNIMEFNHRHGDVLYNRQEFWDELLLPIDPEGGDSDPFEQIP